MLIFWCLGQLHPVVLRPRDPPPPRSSEGYGSRDLVQLDLGQSKRTFTP